MRKILALFFITFVFVGKAQEKKVYTSLEEALKNPESIEHLNLSGQNLSKLPKGFNKFINLKTLDLSKNNLKKLPSFSSLDNLEEMNISNNPLEDLPAFLSIKGKESNLVAENIDMLKLKPSDLGEKKITEKGFEGSINADGYIITKENDGKNVFIKIIKKADSNFWLEIRLRGKFTDDELINSIKNKPTTSFGYFLNKHVTHQKSNKNTNYLIYKYTNLGKVGIVSYGGTAFYSSYFIEINTTKRFVYFTDVMDLMRIAITYKPELNQKVENAGSTDVKSLTKVKGKDIAANELKNLKQISAEKTISTPVVNKEVLYTLKPSETVAFTNEYQLAIHTNKQEYYIYLKKGGKYYIKTATKTLGPYDDLNSANPDYNSNWDIPHTFKVTKAGKIYFICAGEESGPYSTNSSIDADVNDDGTVNWAVIDRPNEKSFYVYYKGKKYGPYNDNLYYVSFYNGKPVYKVKQANGNYEVFLGGQSILKDAKISSYRLIDNKHLFFNYTQNDKEFCRIDEKIYGPFDKINSASILKNDKLILRYSQNNEEYIIIGDEVLGPYENIYDVNYNDISFSYKKNGKYYANVIGENEFGPFNEPISYYCSAGKEPMLVLGFTSDIKVQFKGKTYGPFKRFYRIPEEYLNVVKESDDLPTMVVQNKDDSYSIFMNNNQIDNIPFEPEIYISKDRSEFSFSYPIENKSRADRYFVHRGKKYGPFESISTLYKSAGNVKITDMTLTIREGQSNYFVVNNSDIAGPYEYAYSYSNYGDGKMLIWCEKEGNYFYSDNSSPDFYGPVAPIGIENLDPKRKMEFRIEEDLVYARFVKTDAKKGTIIQGTTYDKDYNVRMVNGKNYVFNYTENGTTGDSWILINGNETQYKAVFTDCVDTKNSVYYWATIEGNNIVRYAVSLK